MTQIFGPDFPGDSHGNSSNTLAQELVDLLRFRRPECPLATLRIESHLVSHLAPGATQHSFLETPGAPPNPFAFPGEGSSNEAHQKFHGEEFFPLLASARVGILGGRDVLILPGLVLSCGVDAPARIWQTSNPSTASGFLLPNPPQSFFGLERAPARLAQRLLDVTPGTLLDSTAPAHARIAAQVRLGSEQGKAVFAKAVQSRGLETLELVEIGSWCLLLASAKDRAGRLHTFPWAVRSR